MRLREALRRARPDNRRKFKWTPKLLFPALAICLGVFCYNLLGPTPWKDSLSRETNRRLKASLERKENISLSALFRKESQGLYLLTVPPYFNAATVHCPEASVLKPSDIETALHGHISRLAVFDSAGLVAIATVNSGEFLCDGPLMPACHYLDKTVFQVDSSSGKPCFRLAEK